jgi:hypothetical protein
MEGNLPNIGSVNNRSKGLPLLDIGILETAA